MTYLLNPLRGLAIAFIAIVLPLTFFFGCGGEKKDVVDVDFDPQTSYTLKETDVETYVSDSGITRYKIVTDTWLIFGKASEPYWYFPDGIYLEKFDTLFNIEASIKADTAYYYERRKLWKLDGNIKIQNLEGVHFETQQLFWDQNKESIYSDSFIRITKNETVNTGYGFSSNQDMSDYKIYHSSAEFLIDMQARSDSVAAAE